MASVAERSSTARLITDDAKTLLGDCVRQLLVKSDQLAATVSVPGNIPTTLDAANIMYGFGEPRDLGDVRGLPSRDEFVDALDTVAERRFLGLAVFGDDGRLLGIGKQSDRTLRLNLLLDEKTITVHALADFAYGQKRLDQWGEPDRQLHSFDNSLVPRDAHTLINVARFRRFRDSPQIVEGVTKKVVPLGGPTTVMSLLLEKDYEGRKMVDLFYNRGL